MIIEGRAGGDNIFNHSANSYSNPIVMFGDYATINYDVATHVVSSVFVASSNSGGSDILSSSAGVAVMIGGAAGGHSGRGAGTDFAIGDEASVTFTNNKISRIESSGNAVGANDFISVGNGTKRRDWRHGSRLNHSRNRHEYDPWRRGRD